MTHDVEIVLIARDEASDNLRGLLPELTAMAASLGISADIVVVDRAAGEATARIASAAGARVVRPPRPGYAAAFFAGCAASDAPFIVTMDADLARSPTIFRDLWAARENADLVVASRYMPGGVTAAPWIRVVLSRLLNAVCARVLSVGIHDLSSGCRLYRRRTLEAIAASSEDFGVLPEVLVRLYAEGYQVVEVPFQFASRATWRAQAKLARLAITARSTARFRCSATGSARVTVSSCASAGTAGARSMWAAARLASCRICRERSASTCCCANCASCTGCILKSCRRR